MGPIKLDFSESLKDSPNFRKNLSKIEDDLDTFENVCKKVSYFLHLMQTFKKNFILHLNKDK